MATPKKLTDKQRVVYNCIVDFQIENGYPPSVREICEATGLRSTSTVHGYITRLEKNGMLQRKGENMRRAILTNDFSKQVYRCKNIPLLGRIAAGQPISAIENNEGMWSVPNELLGTHAQDEVFILEVQGESMINAGIFDGDKIIVKQSSTAENGQIVVAMLDDEATVKRFYKENGRFRLQPENDAMKPIYTDQVDVIGCVIGLLRSY
ncbi:MAG: transcriptional repressor LexA [Christensenellales bacterium]|jgi:repressor LexA